MSVRPGRNTQARLASSAGTSVIGNAYKSSGPGYISTGSSMVNSVGSNNATETRY